jgi:hypothetical protein
MPEHERTGEPFGEWLRSQSPSAYMVYGSELSRGMENIG